MPPVHLPVRLAPDLFMVDNATLEMKVDYPRLQTHEG